MKYGGFSVKLPNTWIKDKFPEGKKTGRPKHSRLAQQEGKKKGGALGVASPCALARTVEEAGQAGCWAGALG